jgi:stage II sporulation protein D
MQKKSNFVKINKTLPVICASIVLIVSIFAADLLISRKNDLDKNVVTTSESMYKQLQTYTADRQKADVIMPKMNNYKIKNANVMDFTPMEAVSRIGRVKNITVLDSLTGRCFSMPLEEYVLCSLVAEMPQSFDMQALMAQAVAVRTYAVRAVLGGSNHKDAHVCTDYRCCQSMMLPDKLNFDVSKATTAVTDTKGIIAVYEGLPIIAAYHSSSIGMTKSSEEVWGGEVAYLVPVFAPESKDVSAKTVSLKKDKVKSVFKKNGLEGDFVFEHDGSGICIKAVSGEDLLTAVTVKRLLGLRSDTFSVSENGDSYTFTSYGFGHGVGMSQYGADALAGKGYSFYEILKYYYTGISFAFLE